METEKVLLAAAKKIEASFAWEFDQADLGMESKSIPVELHESLQRLVLSEDAQKRIRTKLRIKRISKISAAFAIVFLVAFTAIVTNVDAARHKFLSFFTVNTPQYIQFTPKCEEGDSPASDRIDRIYLPAQIPDGYVMTTPPEENSPFKHTVYENSEGKEIFFSQNPADGTTIAIDNEHGGSGEISINGNEGHWVQSRETLIVTWLQDDYMFTLTGELTIDEARVLAESVSARS